MFKSCEPVRLTEEDTEYTIFAVKHVYDAHLVLQFNCTNTVAEQVRVPRERWESGGANSGLLIWSWSKGFSIYDLMQC